MLRKEPMLSRKGMFHREPICEGRRPSIVAKWPADRVSRSVCVSSITCRALSMVASIADFFGALESFVRERIGGCGG